LPFVRGLAGGIPVTVSVTGDVGNAQALVTALQAAPPDFYDYHIYGGCDASRAYTTLQQVQQIVAPAPLFIGETGFSSNAANAAQCDLPALQTAAEAYQDYYLRAVEYAAQALGLPAAAPWTLTAFTPGSLSNVPSSSPEYNFGLLRADGSAKPAAASMSA